MKFSLKHGEHSFAFRPVPLCCSYVWYTASGQRAAFEPWCPLSPPFRIICSVQMTKAYIRPLHNFLGNFENMTMSLCSILIYTLLLGIVPSKMQFWNAYIRLQGHSKSFCLVKFRKMPCFRIQGHLFVYKNGTFQSSHVLIFQKKFFYEAVQMHVSHCTLPLS